MCKFAHKTKSGGSAITGAILSVLLTGNKIKSSTVKNRIEKSQDLGEIKLVMAPRATATENTSTMKGNPIRRSAPCKTNAMSKDIETVNARIPMRPNFVKRVYMRI